MIVYIYAVAVAEVHSEGARRRVYFEGTHAQLVTSFPSSYTPGDDSFVVAVGKTTGENDTCLMMCASTKVNKWPMPRLCRVFW